MSPRSFWRCLQRDESFMKRLKLETKLDDTEGCVNTVNWNGIGSQLAVGGDDLTVCVYDYPSMALAARIRTPHHANIFCAKFVPHHEHLVATCAGDGELHLCDIPTQQNTHCFGTHEDRAKEFVIDPSSPNTILSCSEDGTVRQFDTRISTPADRTSSTPNVLVDFGLRKGDIVHRAHGAAGINSIAMAQLRPHYFAIGGDRTELWLLDRRKLTLKSRPRPQATHSSAVVGMYQPPDVRSSHVTGVALSYDASRLLGSWSHDNVHLFDTTRASSRADLVQRESEANEDASLSSRRRQSTGDSNSSDVDDDDPELEGSGKGGAQAFGTPVKVSGARKSRRRARPQGATPCGESHVMEFKGHINALTVKDVEFIGPNHEFVASGSDYGKVFIWDANTGDVLWIGEGADAEVVNCIAPHPCDSIIATSGIDANVKIWAPTAEVPISQAEIEAVVQHHHYVRSSPFTTRRIQSSDYFLMVSSHQMLEQFIDQLRHRLHEDMTRGERDSSS